MILGDFFWGGWGGGLIFVFLCKVYIMATQ